MARTGRFGRLPRTAPSLASVIVSLAQQMNAQIDQNYIDSWQEGGEVDGVKITDAKLLEHLLKRRDELSPDDPEWDARHNTYLNYSFAIEESKMSLSYAEGKVNDTQMATFYTTWANKLPKDSEAYRNLARSAAQFREAASARASAGGARARAQNYSDQNQALYDRYQQQYERANYWLTQAAIAARIINPSQTIDDLRFASGPDQALFYDLFDQIAVDPDFSGIRQGLAASGLAGMNFDSFQTLNTAWLTGQDGRINLALQAGDREEAEKLRYEKYDFQLARMSFLDLDEMAGYAAAREMLLNVVTDATSDPDMVAAALDDYRQMLERQYQTAQSDDARLMLANEIAVLNGQAPSGAGQLSAAEEGAVAPQGADRVGDLDSTFDLVNQMNGQTTALRDGTAVLHKVRDEAGTFVGWELLGTQGNGQLVDHDRGTLVDVRVGLRGQARSEWIEYHPIMSIGRRDVSTSTGRPLTDLTPVDDQQIGVYYVQNGITYYGIYHDGGALSWTTESPFRKVGTGLTTSVGTDGTMTIEWDVPGTGTAAIGPNGEPITLDEYNPFAPVEANMIDMNLERRNRYDSIDAARIQEDPDARKDILRRFPGEKAAELEAIYGSPQAAEAAMADWAVQREAAGIITQQEWEDKNNLGRGRDVRGGYREFADMEYGPGYGLATTITPGEVRTTPSEADQLETREAIARSRAASMVAQSQFEAEARSTFQTPQSGLTERGEGPFDTRRSTAGETRYRQLLRRAQQQANALPVIALPGMSQSALEAWVRAQGINVPPIGGRPAVVTGANRFSGLPGVPKPSITPAVPGTNPLTLPYQPKPFAPPKPKPLPAPIVDERDLGDVRKTIPKPSGVDPVTGRPWGSGPLR